jgi:hypothetical protein
MPDRKRNVASATRAVRRGGAALSRLTGNPADANINPTPTEGQNRLGKFLRAGGFLPSKPKKR